MSFLRTLAGALLAATTLACGVQSGDATADEPAVVQQPVESEPSGSAVVVERVTPVLAVEDIEAVIPFWESLGFTPTNPNEVDGNLVFIEFVKDGHQIHYQTFARIEANTPEAASALRDSAALIYVTVSDLDSIVERLGEAEIVIPRQQTPWGSDEIYVREPAGHIIGFAAFGS